MAGNSHSDISSDSESNISHESDYSQEGTSTKSSLLHHHHPDRFLGTDGECCIAQVKKWTERTPIGLGLCPWAVKSHALGRIKYVSCDSTSPSEVTNMVFDEAAKLSNCDATQQQEKEETPPPLSTTLIVCPNVSEWNNDFTKFDTFVNDLPGEMKSFTKDKNMEYQDHDDNILQQVTLVAFHHKFLRWYGLPEGLTVGSKVWCHKRVFGTNKKSLKLYVATLLEVNSRPFGRRRLKVRYQPDDNDNSKATDGESQQKQEQYVPTDWIFPAGDDVNESTMRPELSDNMMHRAPYPTIHIIHNRDLYSLCVRDISRVKRKNAQLMMMKFG